MTPALEVALEVRRDVEHESVSRLRHDRQRERVDDQAQLRWTPIERQPEPLVKV
jgi:hypothetical protein